MNLRQQVIRKINEIKVDHIKNNQTTPTNILDTYNQTEISNQHKNTQRDISTCQNSPIHPSTAPKSNVSLTQLFSYSIYSPLVSNHQDTLLTAQ